MSAILMQGRWIGQRHLWLLSGTGEGPLIVAALQQQGWRVSVSVVTAEAAKVYADLSLEALWIGPLAGSGGVHRVLDQASDQHQGFDWVVDATHPFAIKISAELKQACQQRGQPLLRFERPLEDIGEALLLKNSAELANQALQGSRLLMALGSRHLEPAVVAAKQAGAEVFARVLPSPESLRKALSLGLPANHLALLRPLQGEQPGGIEAALCRRWGITAVVCRQSGGVTEQLWQSICKQMQLGLWLISRPVISATNSVVYSVDALVEHLDRLQSEPHR